MKDGAVYNVSGDVAISACPGPPNTGNPSVYAALLTLRDHLRTLAALLRNRSEKGHETYIPAQQDQARAYPWFPCPHGDQSWTPRPQAPPCQGPRQADAVSQAASAATTSHQPGLTSTPGNRFSKNNRLLNAAAFGRVFKKASRSRDELFTVLCRGNDSEKARLGLAISKKHCRRATARNRIKRVIRESFRTQQDLLVGRDIVVINQPGATTATNRELFESLEQHWRRCSKAN
jgi:ribonuclease P protein component